MSESSDVSDSGKCLWSSGTVFRFWELLEILGSVVWIRGVVFDSGNSFGFGK